MGAGISGQDNKIGVLQQEPDHLGALRAYEDYVKSLTSMELYKSNFELNYKDAYGLTEDQFHTMMDEHQIPKPNQYGSKANSVVVMYKDENSVKKTIFIFARSKEHLYDVLVAEGTMSTSVDWVRMATALGTSTVVSGALYYLVSPPVGIVAGLRDVLTTAGKFLYDEKHNNFKDVGIGYMIQQLIAAKKLTVTPNGELAFVRGGYYTVLDDEKDVDPTAGEEINEDDDEAIAAPPPVNPKAGLNTDDSSCCVSCLPFTRKKRKQK